MKGYNLVILFESFEYLCVIALKNCTKSHKGFTKDHKERSLFHYSNSYYDLFFALSTRVVSDFNIVS